MAASPRALRDAGLDRRPGRTCPLAYRYAPRDLACSPQVVAEVVYVVGGLYGNVEALVALEALVAREEGPVEVVFNGDFHWFDIEDADYLRIAKAALGHHAVRGNVETELAGEDAGAGCGCAYPADVSDAEVSRSNSILEMLRETARRHPEIRAQQGALPMHLTAQVGEARIGIVHGDAASLAGWGFAIEALDKPAHGRWIEGAFRDAQVDVFASSHTCLPACRAFASGVVINNGAAGLPNFSGQGFGVVTRIGRTPSPQAPLYGTQVCGVRVDALALYLDEPLWQRRFLAAWPEGSPAHASYFRRIVEGPRHAIADAAPRATP